MKIYDSEIAPNPRRVRIFLAEKNVSVPYERIDLRASANRDPAFLKKNRLGLVPVLELDDGTCIAESVAICRYFEEIHPEPPLMGTDARDRALVEMWNRRMELDLFRWVGDTFAHTAEFFRNRIRQVPAYAETTRERALGQLGWLDGVFADRPFAAGERFTIADITALVAIELGTPSVFRIAPGQKHLARWYEQVASRPSAKA